MRESFLKKTPGGSDFLTRYEDPRQQRELGLNDVLHIRRYNLLRILALGFIFRGGRRIELTQGMIARREREVEILNDKLGLKSVTFRDHDGEEV